MPRHAEDNQSLATRPSETALATLDYLASDEGVGTEAIGTGDITPPRLALCQAMSPQRKRDGADFIAGLEEGFLFNTLTQEVYGDSVRVAVLMSLGRRCIEFFPLEDGGGIKDRNVPLDDPRASWQGDEKPVATKFADYLVIKMNDEDTTEVQVGDHTVTIYNTAEDMLAWSLKSTGLKVSNNLNGVLRSPLRLVPGQKPTSNRPAAWMRVFEINAVPEHGDGYSYYNYRCHQVGVVSQEVSAFAAELHGSYSAAHAEGRVNVDVETDAPATDSDDASF